MTTNPFSQVLGSDHIDLLTSAALRWRVLTLPPDSATKACGQDLVASVATGVGRVLRKENTAALQWLADRGRGHLTDRCAPPAYRFHGVELLDPVEVIKAAHAAEVLCAASPSWSTSPVRQLLSKLTRAACQRLDGYATAPWVWTRPPRRDLPPVAVGGQWRPQVPGLEWVDLSDLPERWDRARVVVVTPEVAEQVPPDLPARPGVFVLAGTHPADDVWQAVSALDLPALVLFWPACASWLADQLRDRPPAHAHLVPRPPRSASGVAGIP